MLKKLVKGGLRSLGFDLVRYSPDAQRPFELVPVIVRDYVRSGEPFFFVQVGANDGRTFDPLCASIREHALPGLLVEPLPDLFEELKRSYEGCPGLLFENVAIGDEEGRQDFHRVRRDHGGPTSWQGLGSFDRRHIEAAGVPDELIETLQVEVVPMGILLARHGIEEITLLQVDTEGSDDRIVRATFEAGIRPLVINYEHCHLPIRRRNDLKRILVHEGYRFLESWSDTTATLDGDRFPGLY